MHTYIIARGVDHWVTDFENDLSAQWVKFTRNGQTELLKLGVRPIKLLEIVYPEENQEDVMRMLMPFGGYKTEQIGKGLYFFLLPLMKALGIRKNTTKEKGIFNNYKVFHPYVDVLVLGHKPDKIDEDGTEKI